MADDLIRYDLLVQDALRGVVRKVLTDAAREGLSGEHHFYVSFRTEAPGVRISQRLREKYPQDMTIVLQHQFWDLGVTEHTFEVGLSFSGVPERLLVPFDALTGFFDPSVQFGLKFDLNDGSEESGEAENQPSSAGMGAPRGAASEPTEMKPKAIGQGNVGQGNAAGQSLPSIGSSVPKLLPAAQNAETSKATRPAAKKPSTDTQGAAPPESSAEVVSLDAFRKKS